MKANFTYNIIPQEQDRQHEDPRIGLGNIFRKMS